MSKEQTEPFIFWTYPWDIAPIAPTIFNPDYTLCRVDSERFTLSVNDQTVSAKLEDIVSCTQYTISVPGPGGNVRIAWIVFQDGVVFHKRNLELNRLCIACMDPLRGIPDDLEANRLIHVINDLRAGKVPEMPHNPYQRALIDYHRADEFSEEKWDATKPPPTYSEMPTRWKALKPLVVIGIICAIFFVILLILERLGILY